MSEDRKAEGLSMRGGEILSALFLLAVSAYVWIASASFVTRSGLIQTLSPALFPRIIATILAIASLVLLVRAFVRRDDDRAKVAWGHLGRLVLAIAVMFGQALIFDEVGVFPSAWLALVLLLLIARVDWRKALVVATGFLLFIYVFFILVLRVPLPTAFLPTLL